ncbi:MAG: aldo/keto reductase [Clostridiales bacterium]|nr:aldo/keto reductase [Clostridiales bacterium]
MKYRKINENYKPSILAFGCMRMPVINGEYGQIDEEKAIEMIRYALDNGINYIDTAYPYHEGNSETVVGKALKDGYREKAILVTKNPVWKVEKYEDFEKYLDEQLEKLDVEYLDIYLLHALGADRWAKILEFDGLRFLDEMKAKGKIKEAAFSFHGDKEAFETIADAYDWSLAMIQMNYKDIDEQSTVSAISYAESKGIPIAIMEPLKGGQLANLPESITSLWHDELKISPVERAFRWAANFENVKVILSGMSTLEQMKENIEIADRLEAGVIGSAEAQMYLDVKAQIEARTQIPCTDCRYCMPCPVGVNIPGNFMIYNKSFMYEDLDLAAHVYQNKYKKEQRASACIECGKCEPQCPQGIKIMDKLKDVHNHLKQEIKFKKDHWAL